MVLWTLRNHTPSYPPLLHWILRKSGEQKSVSPLRDPWHHWKVEPTPQTQEGWWTASSGFLSPVRAECVSEVSRHCFQITWERKQTERKMPFGGLAGLEEQVLKPGKEEVKNTVGDSLGKLQRWDGLYGERECVQGVGSTAFSDVVGLHGTNILSILFPCWRFFFFFFMSVSKRETSAVRGCESLEASTLSPACSQRSWR